jgi:hypothetical protein
LIPTTSGAVNVGASHETLAAATATNPSVGYRMVVENNVVRNSPVCVLVNSNFTQLTIRGNQCP